MKIQSTRKRLVGFTLIELLTVITIIGILAGIIFPVTGMVQRKGKLAKQTNNMRQFYAGLMVHVQENEQTMPNISTGDSISIKNDSEYSSVPPARFGGDDAAKKLLKDPFDKRPDASPDFPVSYAINKYLLAGSNGFSGRLAAIEDTANKYLLMPSYAGDPDVAANWQGNATTVQTFDDNTKIVKPIADEDGVNVLFMNGGVRMVKLKDLKEKKEPYYPGQLPTEDDNNSEP